MDEPVTDVVFVSSKDNCPKGYRIIETCPCGHEAQMWEKVLGGESGERYLCFTKEEKDETVIEDMYIPGRAAQYLYKGYKIVKETVEGDEPMYHKQLAVKKVPRTHASKVLADIIICRSRDNVSKMYKKLDKVNGLCICFRPVDLGGRRSPSPKPTRRATITSSSSTSSTSSAPRSQRGGSVKIGDVSRHMAGVVLNDGGPPYRRASNPASMAVSSHRVVSPLTQHTQQSPSPSPSPSPLPPSPPQTGVVEEIASAQFTLAQESVPTSSLPPPHESTDIANPLSTDYPPPSTSSTSSYPTNSYYPPPSSNASNYPPTSYPSNYPPNYPPTMQQPAQQSSTSHPYPPPSSTSYAPHGASYPSAPPTNTTYPPPPTAPTAYGGGALGFGGLVGSVQPPPPSSGYPSYPQQAPPGGYGGYSAIAGPSFTTAPMASQGTSGPAPYNPYQSQQGHTAYPPPATSGQPSTPNYGFNF